MEKTSTAISIRGSKFRAARIIGLCYLVCCCGMLTVLTSCAGPAESFPPPVPEPEKPVEDVNHVIHYTGETLAVIAKWYTGKSENWKLLVEANPGIKPNRMRLGQNVIIPAKLVTRREPLPKSAVPQSLVPPKPVETTVEQLTTEPFGGTVTEGDVGLPDTSEPSAQEPITVPSAGPGGKDLGGGGPSAIDVQPAVQPEAPATKAGKAVAPEGLNREEPKAGARPEPAAKPPTTDQDAERERLLDELLSQ